MKVLATFDGTKYSESIIPQLSKIARIPDVDVTLLSVGHEPNERLRGRGTPQAIVSGDYITGRMGQMDFQPTDPQFAENREQAFERRIRELEEYLADLAHRLPEGLTVHIEAHLSSKPAEMIVQRAREEQPDVIVMATRSRGRIAQALFGSTTEHVIRSAVAPVLVVHPPEHS
jgi:nucleotide-binding universal stress UspA family protein